MDAVRELLEKTRNEQADHESDDAVAAYRAALDSAVRSLAQREHSTAELRRKLSGKGHDREVIEQVLEYTLLHDLLSDARFVESYVRSRVNKAYGPMRIRQELGQRGIQEPAIDEALTEPGEFWMDIAEGALERKFRDAPENREQWNTQARFLARRGFPSDLIYGILGNHRY